MKHSHDRFGNVWFSGFGAYSKQTDRQTDRQTDIYCFIYKMCKIVSGYSFKINTYKYIKEGKSSLMSSGFALNAKACKSYNKTPMC